MTADPTRLNAQPEFRVKRRTEYGQTYWDVVSMASGEVVGTVFKYLDRWWANTAGSLANRHGSKSAAAATVWARHLAGES